MYLSRLSLQALGAFVLTMALLTNAWADAIDGSWCHNDGRRLSISGPLIITPSGTRTQGHYTRHAFAYAVPAGDAQAGLTIHMTLINDDLMRLVAGEASANIETWRRCGPPVS